MALRTLRRTMGPAFAAAVAAVLVVTFTLVEAQGPPAEPPPVQATIPDSGVRDWDLELTGALHEHGPYRLSAAGTQPVQPDPNAWDRVFGDAWTVQVVEDSDQSPLRTPLKVPDGYELVLDEGLKAVHGDGRVRYLRHTLEYLNRDTPGAPIRIERLGFVAEQWPDGIGIAATPRNGILQITLDSRNGTPLLIEHPSPETDKYPFQRYRWVSDNIETVIEGTALSHATMLKLVDDAQNGG